MDRSASVAAGVLTPEAQWCNPDSLLAANNMQ